MTGRGTSAGLSTVALLGAVVGSLGAPLITTVAASLNVSSGAAQWTLTASLLSGAVAGPVLGRLGSGPYRRTTVLGCLAVVVVGGVLTALPLPFAALVFGRVLQGAATGIGPLLMSAARAHLPAAASKRVVARISVASTVGIGVGYPLIGLVDQIGGLRSAYWMGVVLSVMALVVAWRTVPIEEPGPRPQVGWSGAVLLASGTAGVLLLVADPEVWTHGWTSAALLLGSVIALCGWVVVERRSATPLVDLRVLRSPSVLRADVAMLVGGAGLYLLFSVFTRYVQTPVEAGYGFALSGVAAGAALIPFSVFGYVAGRLAPSVMSVLSPGWAFGAAGGAAVLSASVFAVGANSLIAVLAAMSLLGLAVGGVSAVMPSLLLRTVPECEAASVLTMNQVLRSIGFSVGSAVAGLLLTAGTPPGASSPTQDGYLAAAWWALPPVAVAVLVVSSQKRCG